VCLKCVIGAHDYKLLDAFCKVVINDLNIFSLFKHDWSLDIEVTTECNHSPPQSLSPRVRLAMVLLVVIVFLFSLPHFSCSNKSLSTFSNSLHHLLVFSVLLPVFPGLCRSCPPSALSVFCNRYNENYHSNSCNSCQCHWSGDILRPVSFGNNTAYQEYVSNVVI